MARIFWDFPIQVDSEPEPEGYVCLSDFHTSYCLVSDYNDFIIPNIVGTSVNLDF